MSQLVIGHKWQVPIPRLRLGEGDAEGLASDEGRSEQVQK